jgi:hypothetical protein
MSPDKEAVERRRWMSLVHIGAARGKPSLVFSTQALLLVRDVELAFYGGAWISVIVLCHAAIDATLRQVRSDDYESTSQALFEGDADLQWLRRLRNNIMHVSEPGAPSAVWKVGGGNVAAAHGALESDARRAVELLFRTIYEA